MVIFLLEKKCANQNRISAVFGTDIKVDVEMTLNEQLDNNLMHFWKLQHRNF